MATAVEGFSNQAVAKALVPKVPGLLSAIASSYIIYDILKYRKGSVQRNRILIGLSISDIIGSIAFGFISSWAIPKGTPGVFLAAGNEATCQAQGFLLQLANTTSPLYSGSLSFFYLMTVVKGWKESDLQTYEWILHAIPIVLGIGTAITGLALNLYHPVGLWCWFGPPGPYYDAFRWGMAHSFIWSTIFFSSYVMFALWRKVYIMEKANNRYLQPGERRRRTRSKHVAVQGMLFTMAYFLAYIGGFLTRLVQSLTGEVYFQLIIIMAALLPAQGLFNFIVYMRPRWVKELREYSSSRRGNLFSVQSLRSELVVPANNNNNDAHQQPNGDGTEIQDNTAPVTVCDNNEQKSDDDDETSSGDEENATTFGEAKPKYVHEETFEEEEASIGEEKEKPTPFLIDTE